MGLLGNILILCVLLQKHMQNTFNKLRAALAMFDSMLLGPLVLSNILGLTIDKETFGGTFCYFFWPLQNFSQTASMFMTVAIAIERLRAVSYPHKYRKNQRYRTTKYVVSVTIIALVFNLTKFFEFQPDASGKDNWSKKWGFTGTTMLKTLGYAIYEIIIFKILAAQLIPITLLIFSYAKIFVKLRQNRKRIEGSSGVGDTHEDKKTAEEESMALLFAGVVITSIICNIPEIIVKVIWLVLTVQYPDLLDDQPQWVGNAILVRNSSIALNSSVNVIIYSLLGKSFREECKRVVLRMIGKCKCCHTNSSLQGPGESKNQQHNVAKFYDSETEQLSGANTTSTSAV